MRSTSTTTATNPMSSSICRKIHWRSTTSRTNVAKRLRSDAASFSYGVQESMLCTGSKRRDRSKTRSFDVAETKDELYAGQLLELLAGSLRVGYPRKW